MDEQGKDGKAPFRSGFVCLVGRPNVGKSTLMNRLVGRPVSIITPKPQTTRNRILGVRHGPDYQVVYVDTPGIHQPTRPLNARMVGYAAGALKDAELVLLMVEPQARPERTAHLQAQAEDAQALALVQRAGRPTFLVINKIDRAGEGQVLATIQHYATLGGFAEIVPLSALKGTNVERLEALIVARLPTGPPYFEAEQSTDQPEEMILAELIRQEVFRRTHQEVPYSTAVRVTRLEDKGPTLLVEARIVVERPSQKAILIGRQGRMLKSLGTAARKRIEGLLGTRVYLALQVEVAADWSADPRRLAELGYPEGEA